MDKEIIKRFRDEVNAQDLVLQMYRNYAGKNYWNIICSAMDWIDVVVEKILNIFAVLSFLFCYFI